MSSCGRSTTAVLNPDRPLRMSLAQSSSSEKVLRSAFGFDLLRLLASCLELLSFKDLAWFFALACLLLFNASEIDWLIICDLCSTSSGSCTGFSEAMCSSV